MTEVTPSLVLSWLSIKEGALTDYQRELSKQPMREAVVLQRIEREKRKLNELRQELRIKRWELNQLIARKVLEYKESQDGKVAAAALEQYRKTEIEVDPQIVTLRREIITLEGKVDDQQAILDAWTALYEQLRSKRMILMANIKIEVALATSNQKVMEEI